jgi:hypothetical protein
MAGQGLSTNVWDEAPSWIEKVDVSSYGLSTIRANATHLTLSFFADSDGTLLDSWTITAKH